MDTSRNYTFFLLLFFLLLFASRFSAQAQGETANWYFGQNAALHFNADGSVTSLTGSAMNTPQSCASISDKNGSLLFYTDGETVWNRQHQVMANGSGLLGYNAGSQTCLIIPHPGNATQYYIFHHQAEPNKIIYNLRYSIVDMSAQNGLGGVLPNYKNVMLFGFPNTQYANFICEKMTALRHANNRDVWLFIPLVSIANTREFRSFKITAVSGLFTTPVISIVASNEGKFVKGHLKSSPNGKWLIGQFGPGRLFSFNNISGAVISVTGNFVGIDPFSPLLSGVEFSPDGSKLYAIDRGFDIYQYELSSNNPSVIYKTGKVIFGQSALVDPDSLISGMQLAPNGKIYVSRNNSPYLFEIADPNASDTACHFRRGPRLAAGTFCRYGLPNFMQSYFAPPRFTFPQACSGSYMQFTIPDLQDVDSVKWDFGDAASGSLNASRSNQPSHLYAAAGNYTVKLTVFTLGEAPVFERTVTVNTSPQASLGEDLLLCENSEATLTNKANPKTATEKYHWSTGDTTATLKVKASGTYWLEVSNGLCTIRDSVKVTFKPCPPPFIPNIITQNHDGKNDTFQPQNLPEGNWRLQLYNRWGNKIYETENYRNNWPETKTATGIYYYLLKNLKTGKQFKGWLEVAE